MAQGDATRDLVSRLFLTRCNVVMDALRATSPEYNEEEKEYTRLSGLLKMALEKEEQRTLISYDTALNGLTVGESEAFYLQGLIDGMEMAALIAKGEFHVDREGTLAQTGEPLTNLLGKITLEDMESDSQRIARIKKEIREILPGAQFKDDEEDTTTD